MLREITENEIIFHTNKIRNCCFNIKNNIFSHIHLIPVNLLIIASILIVNPKEVFISLFLGSSLIRTFLSILQIILQSHGRLRFLLSFHGTHYNIFVPCTNLLICTDPLLDGCNILLGLNSFGNMLLDCYVQK